jgi:cytochrome c-type biogenesis protein
MTYLFTTAVSRARLVGRILAFGLGYTAVLLLGGGFVLAFASQVARFPALLRPVEVVAGIFVVLIAVTLFLPRKPAPSKPGFSGQALQRWGPDSGLISHFLLGLSLAVGCLQCMGTVGLSLLLPLLAYSGLTSWFWGLSLLGIFALGLLVPFLLAAFGLEEFMPSLTSRVRLVGGLQRGCALILLVMGGLMVAGESMRMTSGMFWLVDQIHRGVDVLCRPFLG